MSKRRQKKTQTTNNNVRLLWAVGIIAIILVAAAILLLNQDEETEEATTNAALPAEVSVADAAKMRESGAFVLDVREQDEWDTVHIPGAHLIPLGQLPDRLNELPQDQEIVVVCRSGNRSATGRDILKDAGFSQVTSMAGGMNEWQAASLPVE